MIQLTSISPNSQQSFNAVLREQQRRVVGLALRLTGNLADAEDVAQEVFLRLHRGWDALVRDQAVVPAWLRRVTVNLCLDEGRRARRRRVVAIDEAIPSRERGAEELRAEAERAERLNAALASLAARERAAIVLRELEGLSTAEVATELGIAEPTVRVHIANARLKLRALLRGKEAPTR